MKKYYPVIILGVIAIVAIIVRVSQNPTVATEQSSQSPATSTASVPAKTSTTPAKTTVTPRPASAYQRGGTTIDTPQFISATDGSIRVSLPAKNASIISPIRIAGEAKGTWYFEGSFPVIITDANNIVIAETIAKAGGSWMTEKLVPFDVSVTFPKQVSGTRGHIILKKDNPSGLAQNDASLDIPVIFK